MGVFSFLRKFSCQKPLLQSLLLKTRPFIFPSHGCYCTSSRRAFSSSPSSILQPETPPASHPDPKTTLSARMSFVFDQIDTIERERAGKDEALQRIRAWREKKQQRADSRLLDAAAVGSVPEATEKKVNLFSTTKEVEVVHPWTEWIELMERLVGQNYFDHRRKNEDQMVEDVLQVDGSGLGFAEEGFDFTRDWTTVRTACLNFGRDRFDILRSLSRKDIQILVGYGCPSTDVKVVFSAKLLRKHVHLDEGDVCSSCNLRSSCSRAYLLARKEDEARTLDVMRVLLTFGFDPVIGSVENKPLLKLKPVKTIVRKLLHEVVKLSAVPIDPNLPPPVIKKPPPKVKQPPPPPKKRVGRDDIEMKKGDWLCPKCDFMNFAKNTVCLQCDAKRPKRQLLPGEWECPECNFLNYRRNMACFHCEHKRPPDEFMENQIQAKPRGPRTGLERGARIPGVSDAWNFDFDDNESDGADVAAFEFADSPRMGDGSPSDAPAYTRSSRDSEDDDSFETSGMQRARERVRYPEPSDRRMPPSLVNGTGFDDFDDEEDDNVDSYELDVPSKNSKQEFSSKNFSAVEDSFEADDFDDSDHYGNARQRNDLRSYNKPSRQMRGQAAFSGSDEDEQDFDSDTEEWKSSHVADSKLRTGRRAGSGPYRGLSFGSEDDLGSNSDSDDNMDLGATPKRNKWSKQTSKRKGLRRGNSNSDSDGLLFGSGSESDDNDDLRSRSNKMRGNRAGPDRRGNTFRGHSRSGPARDSRFRLNNLMNDRRNSFEKDDRGRSFRGPGRNDRGSRGAGYGEFRANDRGNDSWNSNRRGRGEEFGYRQRGRSNKFEDRSEGGRSFGDDRPRRRIIER
ncbi:uncharacterized protein LOC131225316 [Magnolia sinica]|uniref:uncharacterized protein LOC131225316 n=1 Tax=Magnolia sinica TaxID=86752 RepID=UPI00265882F8|nr:uncharacterized protein LOC131225316 [Magnolia sinica]